MQHFANKHASAILTGLLLLGLGLRILAYFIVGDQQFPDTETYRIAGAELLGSGSISNDFVMPLYPLLFGLFGSSKAMIVLDILLSSFTVLIGYQLAKEVFKSEITGLLTALGFCLYPFFIFYSFAALTETLFIAVNLASFLLLYRKRFWSGSALLVLAVLIRGTTDLINPLWVLTFSLLVHRESWGMAFKRLGTFGLVYAVLLAPWWYHNFQKYQQFMRLNLADGVILYSGNNPMNTSGGGTIDAAKGADMDLAQFEHIKDPILYNDTLKRAAVDFIKENPGRFIELMGLKFLRFWRLWPYASAYGGMKYLVLSLVSFVPILILGIWSLFLFSKSDFLRLSPILLFFVYLTAIHMVTIGSLRYRLPLEPYLIIFTAQFISRKGLKHA